VFLALGLTGTFAFALNGALTAIRVARLDIVGVLTLGMFTALGGGMIRDILLGALPPATFQDWRYLTVAASGGLVAFVFGRGLDRLAMPILSRPRAPAPGSLSRSSTSGCDGPGGCGWCPRRHPGPA
jgi:uncharacterized membrane protein YeiH